ncbi:MAG: hypothetical protein V1720_15720 [bacterium]
MKKPVSILIMLVINTILIYSQTKIKDILDLKGSYIGQNPPGSTPEVFAPGIVSTPDYLEIGCTWSPDGKEFYFVRQTDIGGLLLCSSCEESGWTQPKEIEHFNKYPGYEPFITTDGTKFFYTRFIPPPEYDNLPDDISEQVKQSRMINIWVMEKEGLNFNEPEFCIPGMFCSVAANGNIYTTDVVDKPDRICRYILKNGKYGKKEYLSGGVNSPIPGAHPCIAPDESFIIFDSKRKENLEDADLYVCFKNDDGNWSEAYNLGDSINTKWNDICPSLSPDGKYLFYMSKADIYWVSAEIIEKLKPGELK